MITQSRLKHVLSYNQDDGVFLWVNPTSNRVKRDSPAGCIHDMKGGRYLRITIDGKHYQAHRLAFLYVTGRLPKDLSDHKDGDGLNNKWSNLRQASSSKNNKNAKMRSHNTSGYCGVIWSKQKNKWQARAAYNGKVKHLGFFDDKNDAAAARFAVNKELGFTARHGA